MRSSEQIERARRREKLAELQLRVGPEGYVHGWVKVGIGEDTSEHRVGNMIASVGKTQFGPYTARVFKPKVQVSPLEAKTYGVKDEAPKISHYSEHETAAEAQKAADDAMKNAESGGPGKDYADGVAKALHQMNALGMGGIDAGENQWINENAAKAKDAENAADQSNALPSGKNWVNNSPGMAAAYKAENDRYAEKALSGERGDQTELELRTGPKGYSHGWIKSDAALASAKATLADESKTVKHHLAMTQSHRSMVKSDKHPPHHAEKAQAHADKAASHSKKVAVAADLIMNHPNATDADKKSAAAAADKADTSARLASLEAHDAKVYGHNAFSVGVDPKTGALSVGKRDEDPNIWIGTGERLNYRAPMTAAEQNDLPDSDFAYIEPGGEKDSEGKTTPRSLRHFPIQDAAHVRNALARASTSPFGDKAMPAIKAAAKKLLKS